MAEAFNDVWHYTGQAAGGLCTPGGEESFRETGIPVALMGGIAQECPAEGSMRLHELGTDEPNGMIQPTPSLIARQSRGVMCSCLMGMHRETMQNMPDVGDLDMIMIACRLAEDCGIHEAKECKNQILSRVPLP